MQTHHIWYQIKAFCITENKKLDINYMNISFEGYLRISLHYFGVILHKPDNAPTNIIWRSKCIDNTLALGLEMAVSSLQIILR